jgi:hypothetical protein
MPIRALAPVWRQQSSAGEFATALADCVIPAIAGSIGDGIRVAAAGSGANIGAADGPGAAAGRGGFVRPRTAPG